MSRPHWESGRPTLAASSMGFTGDRRGRAVKDTATHYIRQKSANHFRAECKKSGRIGYGRSPGEAVRDCDDVEE